MTSAAEPAAADPAKDYAFRFDAPIEPVSFGGEADIHGWLLHREGKPVHGIRAVVKRQFFGRTVVRGRRKRSRPDVAAENKAVLQETKARILKYAPKSQ